MFSVQTHPHVRPNTVKPSTFTRIEIEPDTTKYVLFDYGSASSADKLSNLVVNAFNRNGDLIGFVIPAGVENVLTVRIGDRIFGLAINPEQLEPGEFSWDPGDRSAIARLLKDDEVGNGLVVISAHLPNKSEVIRGDCIDSDVSPTLQQWNALDSVSISHQFGSESSFSFSFGACYEDEEHIKVNLANGTVISEFGTTWVVNSLQITKDNNSKQIAVTVSLSHFYVSRGTPSRSPLDKPIKIRGKTKLSEFTAIAQVNYRGQDVGIRVSKDTSATETTTVRQILEERAIACHGFLFYGTGGIELRKWGKTKIHVINESDLRSEDVAYTYSGHGSTLDGIKLHTEYRNLKVNLDFEEESEKKGVKTLWHFENCDDLADMYSCAEDNGFYKKQPSVDILRNPGINFDAGGVIKKATKTTYVNGTPTFQEEWKAGYAFSSKETHRVEITPKGGIIIKLDTAHFPQTFWKEISHTTTDWIFDSDGYLESIRITGTEIARLQQESEKLEAVSLYAQALVNAQKVGGILMPDPSYLAQAEAYEFSENLPINDVTQYNLERHKDYYKDVVNPDPCDPDWIEPKFASKTTRSQNSFIIKENPKNNEFFTFPQILTGKYFRENQTITILSKDKFETHDRKQNSEGEYFKNSRAEGTTAYSEGRPSTHTLLDKEIDYVEVIDFNAELYKNKHFYLNSPGVIGENTKTDEGAKGYRDVGNPKEVLAIAETELSIVNTQNSLTTDVNIHWRSGVEVGDLVLFQSRYWVIFGVEDNRRIERGKMISASFALKLGRLLKPSLRLDDRTSC